MTVEAVVVGRIGVDFTPTEIRTSLADATSFVRAVGGFAGNVATGLARLGIRTGVVSAVGPDGHGDFVRGFLEREGIDTAGLVLRSGTVTQLAFVEVWPPDRFPATFHRSVPAPETGLVSDDIPGGWLRHARLVIVSATLLATEPARSTVQEILELRRAAHESGARDAITILDLDWRPTLWPDPGEAPRLVARAAATAGIVIGSDEEYDAVHLRPARFHLGSTGPEMDVVKHGPAGVSLLRDVGRYDVAGIPVEVLCGTGAGDALAAAFGAGLIAGLDPEVAVTRGNAAGAIVATRLMSSTAMPTAAEISGLLAGSPPVPETIGA